MTKLRNDCNDSKKWSHGKLRDKMLQSTEWGNCCNKIKNISVWSLTTTWVQDTYITILSISGGSALLRGDVGLRVLHGCLQLWSSIQIYWGGLVWRETSSGQSDTLLKSSTCPIPVNFGSDCSKKIGNKKCYRFVELLCKLEAWNLLEAWVPSLVDSFTRFVRIPERVFFTDVLKD